MEDSHPKSSLNPKSELVGAAEPVGDDDGARSKRAQMSAALGAAQTAADEALAAEEQATEAPAAGEEQAAAAGHIEGDDGGACTRNLMEAEVFVRVRERTRDGRRPESRPVTASGRKRQLDESTSEHEESESTPAVGPSPTLDIETRASLERIEEIMFGDDTVPSQPSSSSPHPSGPDPSHPGPS